ncbi:thiol-disulfide oxidoreductase DCC family protein [Haloferula chungangensis]|uniref:Thiol-disulfide oxidoreductase DCC family protein n=1 Tax=Haloferula chungangensis TaxID=1048331 RepID=A0ABW2L5A9_9BACT
MATTKQIIIAFDGDCLMCSRAIRWVADRDHADLIRFTRLQDPIGQQMIAESGSKPLDSMLVLNDGEVLSGSSAVIVILETLGGFLKVPAILGKMVPRPLRDALYKFIAVHRYQWFGKNESCSIPSDALRKRLLSAESSTTESCQNPGT